MGVGYPEDLVVSVALGADMFDCVWPTRTAVRSRHSPPEFQPDEPAVDTDIRSSASATL